MSKAEERAIEKYPIEMYEDVGWRCVDKNVNKRKYFAEGYHQAEKDLELTWEDVNTIIGLYNDLDDNTLCNPERACKEILKQFKERKEK